MKPIRGRTNTGNARNCSCPLNVHVSGDTSITALWCRKGRGWKQCGLSCNGIQATATYAGLYEREP